MEPSSESLAFHAARLLVLTALAGRPQGDKVRLPALEGRTLLAKLDFFVRYPHYLMRAAAIQGITISAADAGVDERDERSSVESRMVRYLYGPWDHVYYPTLAYAIGKQLLTVEKQRGTDVFRLTARGQATVDRLLLEDSFTPIARRARLVRRLFSRHSGNGVKEFIYRNFPDVVGRRLGAEI